MTAIDREPRAETAGRARVLAAETAPPSEPPRLLRVLPAALLAVEQQLEQARRTRQEANRRADEVLARARVQAAAIEQAASERAAAVANAAASAARTAAAAEFAAATTALAAAMQQLRTEYVEALPTVALELAAHVVGTTIDVRPEWFASMVQEVASAAVASGSGRLTVRVHPRWLQQNGEPLQAALTGVAAAPFTLAADDELAPDAVAITTDCGEFTTSIAARIAALRSRLELRSAR